MRKIIAKYCIFVAIVLFFSVILLLSTHFSREAILNVLFTLLLLMLLPVAVVWFILRQEKIKRIR